MNLLVVVQTGLSFGTIFTISWIFFSILLMLALKSHSVRISKQQGKHSYPNETFDTSEPLDNALHLELKKKKTNLGLPQTSTS